MKRLQLKFTVMRKLCLLIATTAMMGWLTVSSSAQLLPLTVAADFNNRPTLRPTDTIALQFNRALVSSEGRVAIFIGNTDFTSLFDFDGNTATYTPRIIALPGGESPLVVYFVSRLEEWKEVVRFTLRVQGRATNAEVETATTTAASPEQKRRLTTTPSLTIGGKSQFAEQHFPVSNRPARPTFADLTLQGSLRNELVANKFALQSQFDVVGSSFQQEALRFGLLGNNAPRVDLSNYLTQVQIGQNRLSIGHFSYGTSRHLINGFGSRGLSFTMPLSKRTDFSVAAMNGSSIVGWGNFFGLNQRQHQVLSSTLGFELIPREKGGQVRLEASALYGSLKPISGFNQGAITDAERSRGGSLRLSGFNKSQRLRFDGGLAVSSFTNPNDPLLQQGLNVVPVRNTTRWSSYLEVGYDVLREVKIGKTKTASLTANYKYERIPPLFRSVAAQLQADRLQNQLEVTGRIGELNASFTQHHFNDNLDGIAAILTTRTRRTAFNLNTPLTEFLIRKPTNDTGEAKLPPKWLPRVSYAYDRTHQFGLGIPVNSGFTTPNQVPDQISVNQLFSADWQWTKWRTSYRFNRSWQDNRQPGRERADFLNYVHQFSFGMTPSTKLDVNFDLNWESARNFETGRIDRTIRPAVNVNWRMTQRAALLLNLGSTLAGDVARTTRNRTLEGDLEWSYRVHKGETGWRKMQIVYFLRYSNRYARSRDFTFDVNNLTKQQTLNTGLTLTFF